MKRTARIIMAALCIASVASCKNNTSNQSANAEYVIETDPAYNINTDSLLEKFPITFPTSATTHEEKGIQNRMLNGFNCWNEGFDAWKNWGDVLYSPESIYNVNGVKMTLEEYQQAMNISLKANDIIMGDFDNMIICGNWAAIRYQTTNKNRQTGVETPVPVTEFVRFKDFGEKGMKVDEGWGGTKGSSYTGLLNFISDEEKEAQRKMTEEIIATVLPETSDLNEKYPILYPVEIKGEKENRMKDMILQDLDNWNSGPDAYSKWVDTFFMNGVEYGYNDFTFNKEELKANAKSLMQEKALKRVKVYNILVRDDWAAIHSYHVVNTPDGGKDAFDSMGFYHFVEKDGKMVVDKCWIKEYA